MNEIKLSTPDITYTPSMVTYDFTAIDKDIQELEKRYLKWVPSEDEITDGTKIAKDINRLAEGLNDEKKEMKRVINNQGILFEKDTMERVKRLKAIRENILNGLDVYEEQRKKEKKEEIRQYFLQEREMEIPLERVWKEDWLKKTCSKKKWQSDIRIELEAITKDYEMLDKMNAEDPELLKSIYLQSWDRLKAIDEYNRQMDIRKKAEELREIKAAQETEVDNETQKENVCFDSRKVPSKAEALFTKKFEITGTLSDFEILNKFMVMNDLFCKEISND